jgi:hypothetical protein
MTRPSLRAAIDAFCKACIYDPGNGNGAWREQVDACSSSNCPLHEVRPRTTSGRFKAPVSSAKDAQTPPEPTDEPQPDVGALLGGIFGHHPPKATP